MQPCYFMFILSCPSHVKMILTTQQCITGCVQSIAKFLYFTYHEYTYTKKMYEEIEVCKLLERIRLRWFGYVEKMREGRIPKRMTEMYPIE